MVATCFIALATIFFLFLPLIQLFRVSLTTIDLAYQMAYQNLAPARGSSDMATVVAPEYDPE